MKCLALVLALAACGSSSSNPGGGSNGSNGGDAASTTDSPPAPSMVTFSGSVTSKGLQSMPLSGVTLGAYSEGSTTAVATATSDAQGNFTMMIPTGGTALQGYVKATFSGYLDTYLYPPTPVSADTTGITVYMVTQSTLDTLSNSFCRDQQQAAKGVIGAEVLDAAMAPVQGAVVSSQPMAMTYCYNSGGFPSSNMHMTDTDGIAYMLNLTAGNVTVSATKSGSTFASHAVNARAGALTLTIIQP